MKSQVNTLLMAGKFICQYRFPAEYRYLQVAVNAERANAFLGEMDLCLARLGDDGAFFMSRTKINAEGIKQIKADFLNFRDKFGVVVMVLDMVRQSVGHYKSVASGEFVSVHELERAVNESSVLATVLANLVNVVPHASPRHSNHENIRRALDYLAKEEYAILTNKETSTYQITGKRDHLFVVLQYLEEHGAIPESHINDVSEEDSTQDLFAS